MPTPREDLMRLLIEIDQQLAGLRDQLEGSETEMESDEQSTIIYRMVCLEAALKYASAHDLRRAFGLRWSARVMPAVLQLLMRHESIDTTMRYYVGRDANAVADVLWLAVESEPRKSRSKRIGKRLE